MEVNNRTSNLVDLSQFDTEGFCRSYTLRRHVFEHLANAGCQEARADWAKYIAPVDKFGGCNPINGNFTALVLPFCRPERLHLVAYILEYAFLHDNVVESIESKPVSGESKTDDDAFTLGDTEAVVAHLKAGRRQLQAKMAVKLADTDSTCAERVMSVWESMLKTTLRDKACDFDTLDDYLDFRIVDTGAPFVESILLFGLGMTLTAKEDEQLAEVVRPCFASLALANDYFSFDREWEISKLPGAPKPVNAVWHYMRWHGVDVPSAKRLARDAANRYEAMFLEFCHSFRMKHSPVSKKIDQYLDAIAHQVSGNVVWSLNCPRYHPEFRYDPNAGLEDTLTARHSSPEGSPQVGNPAYGELSNSPSSTQSTSDCLEADLTPASPLSTAASFCRSSSGITIPYNHTLGPEYLDAPHDYVRSLPSKGVRHKLADALNLWAQLPEATLSGIKDVVDHLHNASLILDDVEDDSELRRGQPAAHVVFGVPQTVNAGSFAILEAIGKARMLSVPNALDITLEQLRELHIGQSHDLEWARLGSCPSETDYITMVAKKTGGLFHLLSRLMSTKVEKCISLDIHRLVTLMGIYFQIRDDFRNLNSLEKQKGFCEDLDEGKFSFPLIHCLKSSPNDVRLRGILQHRHDTKSLSRSLKLIVLKILQDSGSMSYTLQALRGLKAQIDETMRQLEGHTGKTNWIMRLLLQKLSV